MSFSIEAIQEIVTSLSVLEATLLVLNIVLLVASGPLFNFLSHGNITDKSVRSRLHVFRSINILIIAVILYYHIFIPIASTSWFTKIAGVLFIVYLSYLAFYISNYFVLSRFGKTKEVDGKLQVSETYNTRALKILSAILFVIIALIGSIQLLEFDSVLQAGGVIGFIGVFLALTQASWAPDIISGLIILNSNLIEEGDAIQLDGDPDMIGMVYKTKMFHTEILNIIDNHRVMIRNARLRDITLHNLSKFASARGLRESLSFNISYDTPQDEIHRMFDSAFEKAKELSHIDFEAQHGWDIRVHKTGDFSVEWKVYYFIKNIREIIRTRQELTELILCEPDQANIQLATPVLHQSPPVEKKV